MSTPLTIVAGYLGAGKTTVLNHVLREARGLRITVLVNDFGDVNIDADLVEARDDDVIRLAGGCVCCSFGMDLAGALQRALAAQPPPHHLLIEASGVGLPGAIARTAAMVTGIARAAVVVLADVETIRDKAADRYVGDIVRRQLADADLVVLNKVDLVGAEQVAAVRGWLTYEYPDVVVIPAARGRVPLDVLLDAEPSPWTPGATEDRLLYSAPIAAADRLFASETVMLPRPIDATALATALSEASPPFGRAKAIVRDLDGTARVINVVGRRWSVTPAIRDPGTTSLMCIYARDGRAPGQAAAIVANLQDD